MRPSITRQSRSTPTVFFFQNPSTIFDATLVAIVLGGICSVVGIFTLLKGPVENQLASVIILGNMNNVLILIFASGFFTPLEPTVAAIDMIPFFGLILFTLKPYQNIDGLGLEEVLKKKATAQSELKKPLRKRRKTRKGLE